MVFREFTSQWVDLSYTPNMSGVFILVLQHKDINSSQSLEILKVKATSAYIFINLTRRPFFLCALTTAQTIEHKQLQEKHSHCATPTKFNEQAFFLAKSLLHLQNLLTFVTQRVK